MNELFEGGLKKTFVRVVDGLQDAMTVYMVRLIKLTTFLNTILEQNQIEHRNLVDQVFTIKNSLLFDEEEHSYEYNISNDVAMTRSMLTSFLKLSCNHINNLLTDYREYFTGEFTGQLINFVDLSLSEENTNVLNSAYRMTCKSIYKFSAVQNDIFEKLAGIYKPLAIYENVQCLFEDNARLCIYLQAAVERWLHYKIACEEIRRLPMYQQKEKVHLTLRQLSFQRMFRKGQSFNGYINKHIIVDAVELYVNKLRESSVLKASLPACFHAYPELFASMLPKSVKTSAAQILHYPISNFHSASDLREFSLIELNGIKINVSSELCDKEKRVSFSDVVVKNARMVPVLEKHVNALITHFIGNSQNPKILSYTNQSEILTQQILALICPSISVYSSYYAVLFLYGSDMDNLLDIALDGQMPVAHINLMLDTVSVSVVCDWAITCKHKQCLNAAFEVRVNTEFKILVNACDVISSSLHYLPVVNTVVRLIDYKKK